MANSERGELRVEVKGGQIYTLRPDFNAICALEELTGKSVFDLFDLIGEGRMSGLRSCVWCLLQAEHKLEIRTLEDAGRWIEEAGGVEVMFLRLKAMQELNTQPTKEGARGGKAANPRKAHGGIGKRSSRARSKPA